MSEIVLFLAGTAILAAYAFGWWLPNATAWHGCGASGGFSLTRGLFEKPSPLDCLGLQFDPNSPAPTGPVLPPQ